LYVFVVYELVRRSNINQSHTIKPTPYVPATTLNPVTSVPEMNIIPETNTLLPTTQSSSSPIQSHTLNPLQIHSYASIGIDYNHVDRDKKLASRCIKKKNWKRENPFNNIFVRSTLYGNL